MTRTFAVFALCTLAWSGCAAVDRVCTDLAAASVNLTVVDADGAAVPDLVLSYTADGSAPANCESIGADAGKSFVCGWEVEGDFVITATAPGFEDAEESITVGKDESGCHVVGEQLEITMTATAG